MARSVFGATIAAQLQRRRHEIFPETFSVARSYQRVRAVRASSDRNGVVVVTTARKFPANCKTWPHCACILRGNDDRDCSGPYKKSFNWSTEAIMKTSDIEVGDRITFCAVTRYSNKTVIRKVNGFFGMARRPTVRFHGWNDFVVEAHEITQIHKRRKE